MKDIKARLISTIKLPKEGEPWWVVALGWLTFPFMLVIGLVLMPVIGSISLLQSLFVKDTPTANPAPPEEWIPLTQAGPLQLWLKVKGEIRFGPGYFHLKSEPPVEYLTDKTFGDWFFHLGDGILLQEWNSTSTPNTNLLYISAETLEVQVIVSNIPSVIWDIVKETNGNYTLTCNTGSEKLVYDIELPTSSLDHTTP